MRVKLERDLYGFACEGLRTLLFARKEITEQQWVDFADRYNRVKTGIGDRKEQLLRDMEEEMEGEGFEYVGCSAVEDKLQEGVAETIDNAMKANIRVWVLTGDK